MNFALIGAAGYIAPQHMKAIKQTGNQLVVALDPHDSVGILDSYFPSCKFFTQYENFDRHILKYENLDYISICSPNYLHEFHIKSALRLGSNVICEKPLALTTENLEELQNVCSNSGKKVNCILQLRLHPSIKILKKMISKNNYYRVNLTYVTPRGPWYFQSWKGDVKRSGGIETNIGIHFFDLLIWLFGPVDKVKLVKRTPYMSEGMLYLEFAEVHWFLSISREHLPHKSICSYRLLLVDDIEVQLDTMFTDLHTESYRQILEGNGYGISDCYPSIDLVTKIRHMEVSK
ncbi:MAG: oxidoreductase [Deltaproteobacteria bacterium]|nr:MAG: oxidoreductase [Deltaproteobacteria bacterium]